MMRDPLAEALASYIENQAEPKRPLSLRGAVEALRRVHYLAGMSDVTLEQKVLERACQEGLAVEFDIRDPWAA